MSVGDVQSPAHTLFYRALSGRDDAIEYYDGDPEQHPDLMSTVRLPSRAPDGAEHASWHRAALAHRALHHALGTFAVDLAAVTDAFPRSLLAADAYALLEDVRIEAAADRLLAGLRADFAEARALALRDRPDVVALAPRAAALEALVRFSLRAEGVSVPSSLHRPVAAIVAAATTVTRPDAGVDETITALHTVYAALAALRNTGHAEGAINWIEFAAVGGSAAKPSARAIELAAAPGEVLDIRAVPVCYRDVPGPRYRGIADTAMARAEGVSAVEPGDGNGDEDADADDTSAATQVGERGSVDRDLDGGNPGDSSPDDSPGVTLTDPRAAEEVRDGRLVARDRHEFVYPEWDMVARRYLPDWTRVRAERPRAVGAPEPARRVALRYAHLIPGLVDALERVRPSGREIALRLPDGDDLDLDACVTALSDLRAGIRPADGVHSRLTATRRDVAVAFALDLSASTAVRLPPRNDALPAGGERIIDLERDAVALVIEALERVGDAYAVYGFSGAGRDNVAVSVVKELDERYSAATRRRLASLVPDHTTRMAPAIRHVAGRLARSGARTRILIVVSDGRPFDIDYGQQYGEDAILPYAVADTAKALDEARACGVQPYLITVDPSGNDYLAAMCDPREYNVIADARELPGSLARLYLVARGEARATRTAHRGLSTLVSRPR